MTDKTTIPPRVSEQADEREFIIEAVRRAKVRTVHPEAANTVDIGRAVLAAYRATLGQQAAPEAPAGMPVVFMGMDPLNIVRNPSLPMIPDSWRYGFYKSGEELRFGAQDNGPLVAWDAVKDLIEPNAPAVPDGKAAIAILRRAMTLAGVHDVARGMLTIHFSNEWNKAIASPAATTASALPLITDADLPATLEPGFYLVGVTLKGERTPAPATTASASGVIGAGDPEAFFWEFCEKQGYPSDSDMDDALRASFYEGIRYCAVHTPAPAPSREAAPLDDGFLYMCAIEAAYPIPNNPHNSVVQRAMDSRIAFRKGWDAARAALAQQGPGQAAQAGADAEREVIVFGGKRMGRTHLAELERDAGRYRVLRSGRFIDLPQMVVPFTDGQQLYTPEKLDAICDECAATLKAQEIAHEAATASQRGEQA